MPAMPAHPVQQCTPAERIQQLNAIDADVATLLQHASNAIAILASSDAPASQPRPTAGGDEAALGGANDPARAPRPDVADAGRDAAAATATAPAMYDEMNGEEKHAPQRSPSPSPSSTSLPSLPPDDVEAGARRRPAPEQGSGGLGPGRPSESTSFDNLIDSARNATDKEKNMTLWEGIRLYPKAVAWSMLISSCIIMEGYDICLVNNFYGFDAFNRKYGEMSINDQGEEIWQVPARWQAGLSNGAACGEIIGLFINGWVSERIGYRKTVLGCLILIAAFTTIFFTAQDVQTLLAGEILAGLPWGVFQTLSVTYASEVCPVVLRGYLTTWVNCCWGIGQMIGVGVLKAFLFRDDQWAYRIPYGLQWMWPLPLFVGVLFAPESPWWLIRKGRIDDAKKALLRITSKTSDADFDADETIAMMVHTNQLENDITKGASYFDCFRGTDLRRTEIVCMVWLIQNLSGNTFSNYSTYFLEQAGLSQADSYSFAIGQYGINVVGVIGAWAIMTAGVGRRRLYIWGLAGLFVMLMVMGFLGLIPKEHENAGAIATGAMMIGWALFYQCSVGTVTYSLVSELSTRRLQIKTVVLARNCYNIANIVCNVLTPYMVNPTAWNWRNYTGFFWAGTCFLSIVYSYFRLPEPAGRSFAELDLLFEQDVPARKFKTTKVDAFGPSPPSVSDDDSVRQQPQLPPMAAAKEKDASKAEPTEVV